MFTGEPTKEPSCEQRRCGGAQVQHGMGWDLPKSAAIWVSDGNGMAEEERARKEGIILGMR